MWTNLLYMVPVTSFLYKCVIDEEIKMEGNVGRELERVFEQYMKDSKLKLGKLKLSGQIHATYPAGTNLWTIVDGLMTRFHLSAYIDEQPNGDILFRLEESISWKRKY